MIFIEKLLQEKAKEMSEMIEKLQDRLEHSPQGSLRISENERGYSFYQYLPKELRSNELIGIEKNSEDAED